MVFSKKCSLPKVLSGTQLEVDELFWLKLFNENAYLEILKCFVNFC